MNFFLNNESQPLNPSKIVIIEDEKHIAQVIQIALSREGFQCHWAKNGVEGLKLFEQVQPDLVIVDLMLPDINGLDLCTHLRSGSRQDFFIMMLTAKIEEIDRIVGYTAGADDYLGKPFSSKELPVRVRALLRRRHREVRPIIRTACFEIDVERGEAKFRPRLEADYQLLKLTPKEFQLLAILVAQPKRIFSRSVLLEQVWGTDYFGSDRTVDTSISHLRQEINQVLQRANPQSAKSGKQLIQAVTGLGYRFNEEVLLQGTPATPAPHAA